MKDNPILLSVKKRLGDRCVKCGFNDMRALQVDHINGSGTKEVKNFKHSLTYYRYLKKLSNEELKSKYQLLCANCNWIKRYEKDEVKGSHGHKYEKGHPFLGGEKGWIKKGQHLSPNTEFKKGNNSWLTRKRGDMP